MLGSAVVYAGLVIAFVGALSVIKPKAPPGTRGTLTPDVFRRRLPPGFALAMMNFLVTPDASGGSVVSTETRVFANGRAENALFALIRSRRRTPFGRP